MHIVGNAKTSFESEKCGGLRIYAASKQTSDTRTRIVRICIVLSERNRRLWQKNEMRGNARQANQDRTTKSVARARMVKRHDTFSNSARFRVHSWLHSGRNEQMVLSVKRQTSSVKLPTEVWKSGSC
jgi:hypothetical protein